MDATEEEEYDLLDPPTVAEAVTPDGAVAPPQEEDEPLQSVEEYLAARKQENRLFSFQRCVRGRVDFVEGESDVQILTLFLPFSFAATRKARNGGLL